MSAAVEPARAESSRAESSRAEPGRAEPSRAAPSRAECGRGAVAAFQAALPLPPSAGRVADRLTTVAPRVGLALSAACGRAVATPRAQLTRRPAAALPGDVVWFALDCGLDGSGALLVPAALGGALADALLGGPGIGGGTALTALELKVLGRHLGAVVAPLREAFEPLGADRLVLGPAGEGPVAELLAGRDVVAVELETTVGSAAGVLTFALPAIAAEPPAAREHPLPDDLVARAAAFAHVPFDLHVTLPPTSLPASDVEQLAEGDVIRLDHSGDVPLLASLAGRVVLSGVLGTHGRRRAFTVADHPWSAR